MFCEKCGAKLEEMASFCDVCGAKVVAPEPVEETMLPLQPEAAQEAAPVEAVPAEPVPVEFVPVAPGPVEHASAVQEPQPAPAPKKVKAYKPRRKPHIALRILLQFLSFVLCIVLTASLLGTVVLADLNHLMSAGGIKQLIHAVLVPTPAPQRITPVVGALGISLDEAAAEPGFTVPGDLDVGDIPEDLLTGGDSAENVGSIIDWIYEEMEKASDEPLPVTKEQVQSFVEESTVSDFMADKLAGYADDFINGTENTTITTEEIIELLEENTELIEQTFELEITEEVKQEMTASVEKLVVENDLNTVIRQQVFETVEQTINESASASGVSWEEIQPMLQLICSDAVLYTALGTCLVLMLLLCLLNFYNVPAGLTWIAVPSILMGTILTAPLAALQAAPEVLAELLPAQVTSIIASFAGVLLPIHGSVLVLGFGLLLISIVWRIIRGSVRRKRRLAAAA